jgi:hypothetical protein
MRARELDKSATAVADAFDELQYTAFDRLVTIFREKTSQGHLAEI